MSNMERFIELVRGGRIEGCGCNHTNHICIDDVRINLLIPNQSKIDHLCAHIRRWLSDPEGLNCDVEHRQRHFLEVTHIGLVRIFNEGSELDWHLAAAVWCAEREG